MITEKKAKESSLCRVEVDGNARIRATSRPFSEPRSAKRFAVRRGVEGNSREISKLAYLAGGDTLSFILQGLSQTADPMRVYRDMIAATTGMFTHRNCLVAVSRGRIVGIANALPASLIETEIEGAQLTDRDKLLRPRTELNDPQSYLLNIIAVSRAYRRRGVGACLLEAVIDEARRCSFPSVTLHVWADNVGAISFYGSFGFREAGRADIPWHADLPHTGGSLLLMLPISSERSEGRRSSSAPELMEQ